MPRDNGDYDNTNRGALFAVEPDRIQLARQGKMNIEGQEHRAVLTREVTQNGTVVLGLYIRAATLFANDNDKEGAPGWTGPTDEAGVAIFGADGRVASWSQHSERAGDWTSVKIEERRSDGEGDRRQSRSQPSRGGRTQHREPEPQNRFPDDEIPF